MKKKLAMLLAATMLATLFTGCGAGGKEDKGELNLYTWDGMFPQEILDGFEKETGIRINYSNFDYDEDMLAKLEETRGGDYDLVIADDYIIERIYRALRSGHSSDRIRSGTDGCEDHRL